MNCCADRSKAICTNGTAPSELTCVDDSSLDEESVPITQQTSGPTVFESCNSCDDGFRLSGGFNSILEMDIYSCVDIDECNDGTDTCNVDNAACTNTDGSYTCKCNAGYTGDGETCNDVDECNDGSDTCDVDNAACTNTDGSYTCNCNAGYNGDGETCTENTCVAKSDADAWSALGCAVNDPTATTVTALGTVDPAAGWSSCSITCDADGTEYSCDCCATGSSANVCAAGCNAEDCGQLCFSPDCGTACKGLRCAQACSGPECGKECEGEECALGCTFDAKVRNNDAVGYGMDGPNSWKFSAQIYPEGTKQGYFKYLTSVMAHPYDFWSDDRVIEGLGLNLRSKGIPRCGEDVSSTYFPQWNEPCEGLSACGAKCTGKCART